ncbi:MAG: response regulator transcription factor [Cyanobacteria bacterium J06639_14]
MQRNDLTSKMLPDPIRVLIVDDEDLVRYGIKAICQTTDVLTVVGEACNGQAAIAQAQKLQPDVVLMDISMPVMDGVRATAQIRESLPQTKVLILTVHENDDHLIEAMQQGAAGYFLKNTPPEDVAPIIQATQKGYLQIGPSLGKKLFQQLQPPAPKTASPVTQKKQLGITPREKEVLGLVAEGASNREIAQILHITEKTVKNHVSSLLSRVGLRDRTQLALWQLQVGT